MSDLAKTFRTIERNISTLRDQQGSIHEYLIPASREILSAGSISLSNAKAAAQTASPSLKKAFIDAIAILPRYYSPSGQEMRARTDVFMNIASALGYTSIAGDEGSIFLYAPTDEFRQNMEANFNELSSLFVNVFGEKAHAKFRPVALDDWNDIMGARIARAKDYYLDAHGTWINTFIENLADELSKDSFITFLRQRIFAHIYHDLPICYPVAPPKKSAAWRRKREQMQHDFPVLKGCEEDLLHNFLYKHTFVYDQYAIEGVVEAQTGHTVIDAGAFIGDTSVYFSRKVGKEGKVYAFEATPDSASIARENMKLNNCNNVDIVPFALFDKKTTLYLNENSDAASANTLSDAENKRNQTAIDAVRLDDFVTERGIRVDFIKADIEGAEMAMLNGAAKTIARDAPICAIALYHKQDDFRSIPEYLRSLVKDYRFWFRCEAEPVIFTKRG